MTVLVCNDVPNALRGHLKRWFIEPRPNVFVGTLNLRTHRKVLEFVQRNSPPEFGFLCIVSAQNCQGYHLERFGPEGKTGKLPIELSGIPLIADSFLSSSEDPF